MQDPHREGVSTDAKRQKLSPKLRGELVTVPVYFEKDPDVPAALMKYYEYDPVSALHDDICALIEEDSSIPAEKYSIEVPDLRSELPNDDSTIAACNIKSGTVVWVMEKQDEPRAESEKAKRQQKESARGELVTVPVYKFGKGNVPVAHVNVYENDPVSALHQEIRELAEEDMGVPAEKQVLEVPLLQTELPNNNSTIADCNIVSGTAVWVIEKQDEPPAESEKDREIEALKAVVAAKEAEIAQLKTENEALYSEHTKQVTEINPELVTKLEEKKMDLFRCRKDFRTRVATLNDVIKKLIPAIITGPPGYKRIDGCVYPIFYRNFPLNITLIDDLTTLDRTICLYEACWKLLSSIVGPTKSCSWSHILGPTDFQVSGEMETDPAFYQLLGVICKGGNDVPWKYNPSLIVESIHPQSVKEIQLAQHQVFIFPSELLTHCSLSIDHARQADDERPCSWCYETIGLRTRTDEEEGVKFLW